MYLRCNAMEKFVNKVAVVTGSSSGIGSAISKELVTYGIIVVGVARRIENLQKLADELNEPGKPVRFYPVKCDVTEESEIENSFKWITSELGPIAILINCAGTSQPFLLRDVTGESISQIFDTNVKASILCSKLAIESMTKNCIQGHVININSIVGHVISDGLKLHQIYTASKHALKVFSETLRRELFDQNLDIKVTNLSPGAVITEMTRMSIPSVESLPPTKIMQPKDIADACVYVLSTPKNVLRLSRCLLYYIKQNMERFTDKVAVVTGSSSGMGLAISTELVKHGIIVVGVARRIDRLKELAEKLNVAGKSARFYPLKCDITVENEIEKSFQWITSQLGPIAIMINNAGVLKPSLLKDVTGEMISQIFDTNVKATILWAKLAAQNMTNNSIEGHIINVNSIAGHMILGYNPNLIQVYTASKHAQKVFSEALRRELVGQNSKIKITSLSPGAVKTEMLNEFQTTAVSLPPKKFIQPKDIADACVYVLNTPPNVLVSELTIMPLHQEIS
ncbi:uncharacterized protein LOC135834074 [Planococcus citri]|uniref:uncharacterized protein LOC135834074 n=1 Tax=Planococcus citri TaxID=170843 RepID=UPI0031F7D86F